MFLMFAQAKTDSVILILTDFRELNKCIERITLPLPRIDEAIQKLDIFRLATVLDLSQGFYSIPIDEKRSNVIHHGSTIGQICLQASTNRYCLCSQLLSVHYNGVVGKFGAFPCILTIFLLSRRLVSQKLTIWRRLNKYWSSWIQKDFMQICTSYSLCRRRFII